LAVDYFCANRAIFVFGIGWHFGGTFFEETRRADEEGSVDFFLRNARVARDLDCISGGFCKIRSFAFYRDCGSGGSAVQREIFGGDGGGGDKVYGGRVLFGFFGG